MPNFNKPYLQEISNEDWNSKGVSVQVLREDTIHPFINGNKWRKLKYNIADLKNSGKKTLVTFGGAFSNHLVATAAASKHFGINAIGIVRGENVSNDYLGFAAKQGMKLHFISRSDYKSKTDEQFLSELINDLVNKSIIRDKNVFILPEGGSNAAAVKGSAEIMDDVPAATNIIACACGTGATIAGISTRLLPHQKALGISVLKSENYFENEITMLGGDVSKIDFSYTYHFGGYAKKNDTLVTFCKDFLKKTGIDIEPVYTGKLFFAIDDLIMQGNFKAGTKIVAVHTGGIFRFS